MRIAYATTDEAMLPIDSMERSRRSANSHSS